MARRVFFSFHYERDIVRASQVRNSWVTKPDREAAGFWDAASWESVKKQGDGAVKRWIDRQIDGTSVTVVLIGSETANRYYVRHEIEKSRERGNGMLGVYIHNLRDMKGATDLIGQNPFSTIFTANPYGIRDPLSNYYQTYDWQHNNGYTNLRLWIEKAASDARR